ncbi:MAG TPA: hypothetical protein VMH28_18485 [Candidatus Acidoferrales bacterium]|nr:hypothetical protein [Candidatus Acidoferrales bacterium]
MSGIGNAVTSKVADRVTGPAGLNAGLAALTEGASDPAVQVDATQVRTVNVPAEMAERSGGIKYPTVNIYCEKISNQLKEKFRSFSGNVWMAIELRHSQDRLEGLQDRLELYADSAMQMLNAQRGDWGDGMFYTGEYEVSFGPVKQGGRNFIQTAKVTFEVGVSRS